MAEAEFAKSAGRFEAATNVGNHFALIRTRLALERTMMAWVRTAVALIGFLAPSPASVRPSNKLR